MDGILYEASAGWSFLIVTVLMGGATAWLTGRAVARAWRPVWTLGVYTLLLVGALRFLHFALFGGAFFSLSSRQASLEAAYFLGVDFVLLTVAALTGWRVTRTTQMTTQYRWLYERTSPVSWKKRAGQEMSVRC
jgi:hypothetical protein